jgi:serine/threonine protein kinase
MPAKFIPIGKPAHDAERQALRFLVEGLPAEYTVYGNAWLVERSGVIYELDAVVVAPHAVFVVEIKSYRGQIEGTDHDWYIPHPIQSPLKKNRVTAQVLKSQLRNEGYEAGQPWVQGFVFLSATTNCGVRGPASGDRLYTRKRIVAALQDEGLTQRLSNRASLAPTAEADKALVKMLTGAAQGPQPIRKIREYDILETLTHHDTSVELLGQNRLSETKRVLRIYSIPPLATDEQRKRIAERTRWEAQVLAKLGNSEGILKADPPFDDGIGIVVPFENFEGITLTTWIEKYGPGTKRRKDAAPIGVRTDLWLRIAKTLDEVHEQGVVHRLLRPEVILVEDSPEPKAIRVTGFDLAKQLKHDSTVQLTSIGDERLVYAAPEVVNAFSDADPASDQFSLGAILCLLLTSRPLFASTRHLMAQRGVFIRVRDLDRNIGLALDEAVTRMVALKPTDRYPKLRDAMAAIRKGRENKIPDDLREPPRAPLDPDDLEAGVRVGTDYEILSRLGIGGMAVVYAARHLVSGRTRALKIAHAEPAANEALSNEHQALDRLDHPNIVKVIDISKMIDDRLTLVMERVGGETLRQWLHTHEQRDFATMRRIAEDLLAGLDYLEQRGVTHKDLKPENLLIGDGRLTIIDFSLAGLPEDAPYGGTALYRDPSSIRWSHASDRFAAALCLFELYAGRHAFEGVPQPGAEPSVNPEDIDPPGLAGFFRKALHPVPEQRFSSARTMRDTLVLALGDDARPNETTPDVDAVDVSTPLKLTGLSRRAINALTRGQISTVGDLLKLPPTAIRSIHAIGRKTAAEVLDFQKQLRKRGLQPVASNLRAEAALMAELSDSPEPVGRLPLPPKLLNALAESSLLTVGAVARLTRSELLGIPGIGRKSVVDVVEALHTFDSRSEADNPHTLDRIWTSASRPLTDRQRVAVERQFGLFGEAETQGEIAQHLGVSPSQVSHDCSNGIDRLDRGVLADLTTGFDVFLDALDGIMRIDELGQRLEDQWPGSQVTGAGMVRLLVRLSAGRADSFEVDGVDVPLTVRTTFDRETLRAFAGEVMRVASHWPPIDRESARRTLASLLPNYGGDPLSLGVRLCQDVELTNAGQLFVPPIDAPLSIRYVLAEIRDPILFVELEQRVKEKFGPKTPYPDADHVLALLSELDCQVQGDKVIPGKNASIVAGPPPPSTPLPTELERTPEEVTRDMLGDAARSRGFRMLVVPPERHEEIGRSVAEAIRGTWLSFADAFFQDHANDMATLERAERFAAQRGRLTDAAEQTLFALLDKHGRPGNVLVLGDTPLFGLCDALDLPRRLYDETLSGSRGFWVLIVPGVTHNRQPLFNESVPMWHLEGATTSLLYPLPPTLRG